MRCNICGEAYKPPESHACAIEGPRDIMGSIPWWIKAAGAGGVAMFAANALPATVVTLAASGVLIGGVWIVMLLMPLGDTTKDWLARHPRTFMAAHIPTTVAISMLGEGIILAFGNLLGGVIATMYLMSWGHKRHVSIQGKKMPGYIPPEPDSTSLVLAQTKYTFFRGLSWIVDPA